MAKKVVTWLLRIVVVLALVDGAIDLGRYGLERAFQTLKNLRQPAETAETKAVAAASRRVQIHLHPGGARTATPPGAPLLFSIDPDGLRHSPNGENNAGGSRLTVLGASLAYGLTTPDDSTLSARMARLLPGWSVDNAAMPGQGIVGSMQNLQYVLPRRHPQVAILVGGMLDLLLHCEAPQEEQQRQHAPYPTLLRFYALAKLALSPRESCTDGDNPDFVINRIIYDIEAAQNFATRRGIRFALVLHPIPTKIAVKPIIILPNTRVSTFTPYSPVLIQRLRQRLAERPDLRVFDLIDLFDDHPEYFADTSGHLTVTGTTVLADRIVNTLTTDCMVAPTIPENAKWPAPGMGSQPAPPSP